MSVGSVCPAWAGGTSGPWAVSAGGAEQWCLLTGGLTESCY